MHKDNTIAIYEAKDGTLELHVKLQDDTVWLSQKQMANLFDKDVRTVNEHIHNIYTEKELGENSTVRKFRIVQKEGNRKVVRSVDFYNLDVIISVGYRVKSQRGTQFRIWATKTLKNHILKGYTLNQQRLVQTGLHDFENAIALVKQVIDVRLLSNDETKGLVDIISRYTKTWVLLRRFDSNELGNITKPKSPSYAITFDSAISAIEQLKNELIQKGEATDLFGNIRGNELEGIIGNLYQTYSGEDLYSSIEEKAAHLLYFIIKDHPFTDGNKRIGAFLFILYLSRNSYLVSKSGEQKLNPNGLAALALLIAESDPVQKGLMIKLIMHFITSE